MKKIILFSFLGLLFFNVKAQQNDFKPSESQFMIRGYGNVGFDYNDANGDETSSFSGGNFVPIFLFKATDRLMFESEVDFNLSGDEIEIDVEYADIIYVLNDYMNVRAGKFLLPFGTFMERLHPSWINRMPTRPLGFGHDGIAPISGVGVELRGAFRIGAATMNYSVYGTNGPRLKTPGGEEPEESGMLMFSNLKDNNNSRAYGTRIGFLPFSDSSTEIGFSYYTSNKVGTKGSVYENIGANLYAIDFSYVKQLPAIGGTVDVKAQYNKSKIDNTTYNVEEEPGEFEDLIFNNESKSYYGQLSYRPTMSETNFIKNLEFVGRYSKLETPEGSGFQTDQEEFSMGLNYWLNWHSVLKLNYQNISGTGGHDGGGEIDQNGLFVQWALGF
jgi:hypothetical protein